jgi:DNA modification methylase
VTIHYRDDWLTVMLGDCREVMALMEPESVHCVVTSPPYWGLRDYGTATWLGGDEACDHVEKNARGDAGRPATMVPRGAGGAMVPSGSSTPVESPMQYRATCGKCGATRVDSQLGLEPTPEAYVESMVAVFREVRRVLRSDGTVWLNLGDSYAATSSYQVTDNKHIDVGNSKASVVPDGLKPKDLVGIPWRVAFALQADGWYLRSDIIWSKPNPMPESVTDRPTKSHEYLFLLSKSPRYYFDADAVREAHGDSNTSRDRATRQHGTTTSGITVPGSTVHPDSPYVGQPMHRGLPGVGTTFGGWNPAGRNIRSVWTIATQPYPGAHFATFPQALVEPCIKAGTSARGVCPECGAPWERVVERTPTDMTARYQRGEPTRHGTSGAAASGASNVGAFSGSGQTTGWVPACHNSCPADWGGAAPVPATVLDPFAGSGTVGLVAQRLSRRAVLIDLNADYLGQVMDRNRDIPLGLGA